MKWTQVSKKLPEDCRMVFVCKMADDIELPDYYGAVVYKNGLFGAAGHKYTHWMYPPSIRRGNKNAIK